MDYSYKAQEDRNRSYEIFAFAKDRDTKKKGVCAAYLTHWNHPNSAFLSAVLVHQNHARILYLI